MLQWFAFASPLPAWSGDNKLELLHKLATLAIVEPNPIFGGIHARFLFPDFTEGSYPIP